MLLFRLTCSVHGDCSTALRILRMSDPGAESSNSEHKVVIGRGGYRIDASRNMWKTSGLKIDSTSTDVVWCWGGEFYNSSSIIVEVAYCSTEYSNKILTSGRNGDLIMWDLNKPSKYGKHPQHIFPSQLIAYPV